MTHAIQQGSGSRARSLRWLDVWPTTRYSRRDENAGQHVRSRKGSGRRRPRGEVILGAVGDASAVVMCGAYVLSPAASENRCLAPCPRSRSSDARATRPSIGPRSSCSRQTRRRSPRGSRRSWTGCWKSISSTRSVRGRRPVAGRLRGAVPPHRRRACRAIRDRPPEDAARGRADPHR